jgi:hypothetical protein
MQKGAKNAISANHRQPPPLFDRCLQVNYGKSRDKNTVIF